MDEEDWLVILSVGVLAAILIWLPKPSRGVGEIVSISLAE